jgi:hypothetical protein
MIAPMPRRVKPSRVPDTVSADSYRALWVKFTQVVTERNNLMAVFAELLHRPLDGTEDFAAMAWVKLLLAEDLLADGVRAECRMTEMGIDRVITPTPNELAGRRTW